MGYFKYLSVGGTERLLLRRFKEQGITGLLANSRQKKNTILRNQDIVNMIIETKFNEPDMSGLKVAQKINKKFKTDYKKRAIEKTFKALGLLKKNKP